VRRFMSCAALAVRHPARATQQRAHVTSKPGNAVRTFGAEETGFPTSRYQEQVGASLGHLCWFRNLLTTASPPIRPSRSRRVLAAPGPYRSCAMHHWSLARR
jgi:hypothetical protein